MRFLKLKINKLKEKFEKTKNDYQYFFIKDYVEGYSYICDFKVADIFFSGKSKDGKLSDEVCYLSGLVNCIVDDEALNNDDAIFVTIKSKDIEIVGENEYLEKIIKDFEQEVEEYGIDFSQTREKKESEKNKRVRIIGCYKTKEEAFQDWKKYYKKNNAKKLEAKEEKWNIK